VVQDCGTGACNVWMECGTCISHADRISSTWQSVEARGGGGRLHFFTKFPILSNTTLTISVTYKNSRTGNGGLKDEEKDNRKITVEKEFCISDVFSTVQ
jgi:hypothetical protein